MSQPDHDAAPSPPPQASILVFDLAKQTPVFKALTSSLEQAISAEIARNYASAADSDANLLYQVFSPLLSSFEISRDMSFLYESLLFGQRAHAVRFTAYKGCLLLCLHDSSHLHQIDAALPRSLHADFHSAWFSKSFLSLLKYKFGVCADEQCFRHAAAAEVRALFAFWSALFARTQVFFVEAIEQLEVNEDVRLKCEAFMNELAEFFTKTELVVTELDYIDENILKLPCEEEASAPGRTCDELEGFFTDLGLIDQFLLSYGTKLLHRFKPSLETSSLFMLLLEASEFTEQSLPEEARAEEVFESAPSTPSNRTFDERFSTPLIAYDSLRRSSSPSDAHRPPLRPTQFKKTHAFLADKAKGLGFYDVVFLQLDKNLCLTLLKRSRLNRFCQLIAEFDGVVQGFLVLYFSYFVCKSGSC